MAAEFRNPGQFRKEHESWTENFLVCWVS